MSFFLVILIFESKSMVALAITLEKRKVVRAKTAGRMRDPFFS